MSERLMTKVVEQTAAIAMRLKEPADTHDETESFDPKVI
jgi:hypothetical protein